MKSLRWALALAFLLPATFSAEQAPAQDTVSLKFCNKTKNDIVVAVITSAGQKRWVAHGWYGFKPGCSSVPNFPRGYMYFTAYEWVENGAIWESDAIKICVPLAKFERVLTEDYTCKKDEYYFGFQEFQITENSTINFQ